MNDAEPVLALLRQIDGRHEGDPNVHRFVETVRAATEGDTCAFIAIEDDVVRPRALALDRRRPDVVERFTELPPLPVNERLAALLDDAQPAVVSGADAIDLVPAEWSDTLRAPMMAIAVVGVGDDARGLVVLTRAEERPFSERDIGVLAVGAGALRVALWAADTATAAREVTHAYERLATGAEAAAASHDVIESMQVLLDLVVETTGRSASIELTVGGAPCAVSRGPRAGEVTVFPLVAPGLGSLGTLRIFGDPVDAGALDSCVAITRVASALLERARLREEAIQRSHLVEVIDHVPHLLDESTEIGDVLARLNRDVCRRAGVECVDVAFRSARLAGVARTRRTTTDETAVVRRSKQEHVLEATAGDLLVVTVPVDGRNVGVMTARVATGIDQLSADQRSLLRTIARALGDLIARTAIHEQLRAVERRLEISETREQLAHHLDDTLGDTLRTLWDRLRHLAAAESYARPVVAELGELRDLAGRGLLQAHMVSASLSLLKLRHEGSLLAALRALLAAFSDATSIGSVLRVEGEERALPAEVEEAIYLAAFEALSLEEPARATAVVVTIDFGAEDVALVVRDDGIGLSQRSAAADGTSIHHGLGVMRARLRPVGGSVRFASARPRGVRLEVRVPAEAPPGDNFEKRRPVPRRSTY